jgi:hypothetical protein
MAKLGSFSLPKLVQLLQVRVRAKVAHGILLSPAGAG